MPEKLKNMFFSDSFIEELSILITSVYTSFRKDNFKRLVLDDTWKQKELKEKMRHVTECLHKELPEDYPEALDILLKISPKINGFDAMIFPDFVECYGMEHWELSLPALKEFTKCCSSEFGIRPFLDKNPEKSINYMLEWAEDPDENVRRLASEGCRPRLPWAMALKKFKKDPAMIIPILEKLKNDQSEYVRRSVANNLNDISKDNPDIALEICTNWYGKSNEIDRIVKHGCRGMLKSGNKKALILFGFGDPEHIEIDNYSLEKSQLSIGNDLHFSFDLRVNTEANSRIRLEYIIHYVKSNKKLSKKVFQIKESDYTPGKYNISRKQTFKDMSTRKHYPGIHYISLIVNGVEKIKKSFELIAWGK